MRTLTTVFKALSDETRLQMLGLVIEEKELCVCDFTDVLEITQSKASRHLRHLVNAGLLDDRRDGTWVYFKIVEQPKPVQQEVLGLLPAVLEDRMPQRVIERLDDWRKNKERGHSACSTPPNRRRKRQGGGK